MTIKAEHLIGKTQWAKWNDDARAAFNKMRALGFTFETAVAEANATQTFVAPAPEDPVASAPAPAPKPRAPRIKKDK
jgi:hypothetical protein